jgi:hypothetical protein
MELLSELSIAEMCSLYNCAIENHSLPVRHAKKFTDRKSAYARIEALLGDYALQLWSEGGTVAIVALPTEKYADEDAVVETAALEPSPMQKGIAKALGITASAETYTADDAAFDKSTTEFQEFWAEHGGSFNEAQAAWLALTPLQFKLMDLIAHHEYNTTNGATPKVFSDVNTWLWPSEWAEAMGISGYRVGGLLTSLENDGFIGMNKVKTPKVKLGGVPADESTVWFTPKGFSAWQAAAAKPVEVEAKPAPAAKKSGGKAHFANDQVITVLVANPKKPGSLARIRFAKYKDGMTVREALEAGLHRTDFKWDTDRGHINIV